MILTLDTPDLWRTLRHFLPREFDGVDDLSCPCCGLLQIDYVAMQMHDRARHRALVPFRVTRGGGCRCADYQQTLVDDPDYDAALPNRSAHVPRDGQGSTALDVSIRSQAGGEVSSYRRHAVLRGLFSVECQRIGVYPTFIHADFSRDLPRPVVW